MTDTLSILRRWFQTGVVIAVIAIALALLLPAIQRAREAAIRTQSKNNLRQIGLAIHNYHDTMRCFPPGGIFDSHGRGVHGWQTAILPFVESSPLYSQIEKDQPWDSIFNADFFRAQIPIFKNPGIDSSTTEGSTFALTHFSANAYLFGANSSFELADIPSSSDTILVAESDGDFVPWGCPYNWRRLTGFDARSGSSGASEETGRQFLMVDGSVRSLTPDVFAKVLEALRGPDLAHKAGGLTIERPRSFPFPDNAWRKAAIDFGAGLRCFGMRDSRGELVRLELGRDKGSTRSPDDDDLVRLSEFPHLKKLVVGGIFSDRGVAELLKLTKLEELSLHSDKITDECLAHLDHLNSLTSLFVSAPAITSEGIQALQGRMPFCRISHWAPKPIQRPL